MAENKLVSVEQKTVLFYDDELIAIRADDGHIYVSFRHLCDSLGVSRQSQMVKVREHDVLHEGYKGGTIVTPPSASGRGGGRQQTSLLRVDLVPMWLTTINASRVKKEVRDKIKRYQREAAKVLWEAFQQGRLTSTLSFDELLQKDSPAVNAYKAALAIVDLARNQVLLESRIDEHEDRLEQIEATLGDPGRHVTPEQASQISQAVKAIAMALSKQTRKNEYGGVYGELYRRFGINSYKELPSHRFDEAMKWLNQWLQSIVGDEPF